MKKMVLIIFLASFSVFGGYDPSAIPPLPRPEHSVTVSTVEELQNAVSGASPGTTILLSDGDYHLTSTLRIMTDSLTLRGASDDPFKAVLRGRGFGHGDKSEELVKIEAVAVGLAYLTIRDVRGNGLKIQTGGNHDILVHNCHFIDICERSIKGPAVATSRNGIVRYCFFEQQTPITDDIPDLTLGGDYIAGMDMMDIDGWHIHDNFFKNIRGMNGGGRAGIFLWRRCSNIIIERNTFLNCDRGIALGNYSGSESGNHVTNSVCRNNFVASDKYDAGIEIAGVDNVGIYNNTIWKSDRTGSRGIRFIAYHTNVDFRNNLINGRLIFDRGDEGVSAFCNVAGDLSGYFVDAPAADLHLTSEAVLAIGQGQALKEVTDDWDGNARQGDIDIGASQYKVPTGVETINLVFKPSGQPSVKVVRYFDILGRKFFSGPTGAGVRFRALSADGTAFDDVQGVINLKQP